MPKRVVIVEDNELNLKLFGDVLRANGYAVEPVGDGALALDRVRETRPDLIVTDMRLGTLSGLDLIADLKRDTGLRGIPVLAMTAYTGPEEEQRARLAGAAGYLSKPVPMKVFVDEVARLAQAARA